MIRRFVDLSHPIRSGMVTYPGLPGPLVTGDMSREASAGHYSPGTTFHVGRVEMVANTGTYVDAPLHRFADGADIAALPLERLADLEGLVVDALPNARAVNPDVFASHELRGRAVLIRTGWSRHFGTPSYAHGHPFLSRTAAERLISDGATLVGIDLFAAKCSRAMGPR